MTIAAASDYAAHRRYLLILGLLFAALWTALAINPWYRADWAIENVLVVVFVLFVAFTRKRLILGTQGDVWDAHKDIALASLGALIAMLITFAINRSLQRDFASEWAESLRVKHAQPLGEDEIARMLDERDALRRTLRSRDDT